MKQIISTKNSAYQDDNAFILQEAPTPHPEGKDILVKIESVSVNPVDNKVRASGNATETKVLGYDAYGVVEEIGEKVHFFSKGDKVFYAGDITRDGSNATHQLVNEELVGLAPHSIGSDAAVLPLTALTAWESLFEKIGFVPSEGANTGKSVLIIGGAGGVGSIAIQLAKWAGLRVYATASRPETKAWCKTLGADEVFAHGSEFADISNHISDVDGVFVITGVDDYWNDIPPLLKVDAHICLIEDPKAPLNMSVCKLKRISTHWEMMFSKAMYNHMRSTQHDILNQVAKLIDSNTITSTTQKTLKGFSIDNLREAHRLIAEGRTIGKILIEY